jgi:hypothetical protein
LLSCLWVRFVATLIYPVMEHVHELDSADKVPVEQVVGAE